MSNILSSISNRNTLVLNDIIKNKNNYATCHLVYIFESLPEQSDLMDIEHNLQQKNIQVNTF